MSLLFKEASVATQSISRQADFATSLIPMHSPAACVGGLATPVGSTSLLSSINAAGAAAIGGSGIIVAAGTAQTPFNGTGPANGYFAADNSSVSVHVCDVRTAEIGGSFAPTTMPSAFTMCSELRPTDTVSLCGGRTGHASAAQRWVMPCPR